jgi:hypothetical protein
LGGTAGLLEKQGMMRTARPFAFVGLLVVLAILMACSPPRVQTANLPPHTLTLTADDRLIRDATATAGMATIMVSPAAPSETPVPDLSSLRGVWNSYTNDDLGITFEYPAAYDTEPLKSLGCGVRLADNTVFFGYDNALSVAPAEGLDLAEYVDRYIQQRGTSFNAWRRGDFDTNGALAGIIVEYFLRGGVNHSGIVVFFQQDNNVYVFNAWLSLACSAPDIDVVNPEPFYRAVETFRVTK